jgi:hypothetical protein
LGKGIAVERQRLGILSSEGDETCGSVSSMLPSRYSWACRVSSRDQDNGGNTTVGCNVVAVSPTPPPKRCPIFKMIRENWTGSLPRPAVQVSGAGTSMATGLSAERGELGAGLVDLREKRHIRVGRPAVGLSVYYRLTPS